MTAPKKERHLGPLTVSFKIPSDSFTPQREKATALRVTVDATGETFEFDRAEAVEWEEDTVHEWMKACTSRVRDIAGGVE